MNTLVNNLAFVIFTWFLLFSPALISGQVVEKRVKGSTYVYDYTQKKVYNKTAIETPEHSTTGFYVEPNTYVADTFCKVLSEERINGLRQERVGIYFVCDNTGHVKTIRFLFLDKILISK